MLVTDMPLLVIQDFGYAYIIAVSRRVASDNQQSREKTLPYQ